MLLKRWGSFLLIFMIVLAACGTADTPDVAHSDTGFEASTTPDGPNPAPEATVTGTPAPATNIPTIETIDPTTNTPSVEPTLESTTPGISSISSEKKIIIPLKEGTYPTFLSDWSPDGNTIVYTQKQGQGFASVYTVDVSTLEQKLIEANAVTGIALSYYYEVDFNAPYWSTQCCSLILAVPSKEADQDILKIERNGSIQEKYGSFDKGKMFVDSHNDLYIATNQGLFSTVDNDSLTSMQSFSELEIIVSTSFNNSKQIVFVENKQILQVYNIATSTLEWSITVTDLLKSTQIEELSEADIPYYTINSPRWSPDEKTISFWLSGGDFDELWIIDATGSKPRSLVVQTFVGINSSSWSANASKIAYSMTASGGDLPPTIGAVIDIATSEVVYLPEDIYLGPIWHPSGTQIAITPKDNTEIHIYTLGE